MNLLFSLKSNVFLDYIIFHRTCYLVCLEVTAQKVNFGILNYDSSIRGYQFQV